MVDLIDRILDKGVVVIGDITISLCNVELLNIKLKLLVASVDRAKELGVDFGWAGLRKVDELEERVRSLETREKQFATNRTRGS